MPNKVKVQEITDRIVAVLRDESADSWPESVIHKTLIEAEKTVINFRPDAGSVDAVFTCAAGPVQTIKDLTDPAAHWLLEVKYNVDASDVPTSSIRRVDIDSQDAINRNWRIATPVAQTREVMYDDREPLIFYLNPPIQAGSKVQISYCGVPPAYGAVDANTETLVSATYEPMLMEFSLYRLLSHDVEGSVNIQRSQAHLNNFQQMMGIKVTGEEKFGMFNPEHRRT